MPYLLFAGIRSNVVGGASELVGHYDTLASLEEALHSPILIEALTPHAIESEGAWAEALHLPSLEVVHIWNMFSAEVGWITSTKEADDYTFRTRLAALHARNCSN